MKMNSEEKDAIVQNLVANNLIVISYNTDTNKIEKRVNQNGIDMYATILRLLGKTKILNGIYMDQKSIERRYSESIKDMIFEEQFMDTLAFEDKYVLTKRGMEHINIMFSIATKSTNIVNKLIRFIGLKG